MAAVACLRRVRSAGRDVDLEGCLARLAYDASGSIGASECASRNRQIGYGLPCSRTLHLQNC